MGVLCRYGIDVGEFKEHWNIPCSAELRILRTTRIYLCQTEWRTLSVQKLQRQYCVDWSHLLDSMAYVRNWHDCCVFVPVNRGGCCTTGLAVRGCVRGAMTCVIQSLNKGHYIFLYK